MRGATHFCGVIGWPLEHTLSPAIHNAAFRKLGIDWVYFAWPVPPEGLGDAVKGLKALGAAGANVTMPHKQKVLEHLDDLSGDARAIGAVNAIQRVGGSLIGHNTDVDGFAEFLASDVGFDALGSTAVVIGAGGAARAVVVALARMAAGRVAVVARNRDRATEVASLAGPGRASSEDWGDLAEVIAESTVVVNTTPVGGNREDPAPGARFAPGQLVVDLVYSPPSTPFVERARRAGADAWGGLGMLVHQGAASFRIWTGQSPPVETMSAAALHAIRQQQTE